MKIPKRAPDKQHHVDERLLEAVRHYLGAHTGSDGQQTADSLIGARLGHSDRSIAEALSLLEANGEIAIFRDLFPPVIVLQGWSATQFGDSDSNAIRDLKSCMDELSEVMERLLALQDENATLRNMAADWAGLAPRLIQEVYVPTSKQLILAFAFDERPQKSYLVRKEDGN